MPQKIKYPKQKCFVRSDCEDWEKDDIQKLVCVGEAKYEDVDDKNFYCLLHFRSGTKETEFNKALYEKLDKNESDFRYVWFPKLLLENFTFENVANFQHAFFSTLANFRELIFKNDANFLDCRFNHYNEFSNITFNRMVIFANCIFDSMIFFSDLTFRNTDKSLNSLASLVNFQLAEFKEEFNFSSRCDEVIDFSDTIFHQKATFDNSTFLKGFSTFSKAIFKEEAYFQNVNFGDNSLEENYDSFFFNNTIFEKTVSFQNSNFLLQINFSNSRFKNSADFRKTTVKTSINFEDASFESFAKFSGQSNNHTSWAKEGLNFTSVEVEKPERISFQSINLKPDSFNKTDIKKFDFTDIKWDVKEFRVDWSRFKDLFTSNDEAEARRTNYVNLEKTYRRFASYAEENNDYQNASKFRFTSFDIQRITPWYGRLPITLLWWYKWTSRYGESWIWSLVVFALLIIVFFPYVYTNLNFRTCAKDRPIYTSIAICESKNEEIKQNCTCSDDRISFGDAVIQSLTTATFQNIEYRKPITWRGELWIILEKIFAPLQAALLALAIRRKFMR